MAAKANPFPEYPVSRLDDPLAPGSAQTALTWPITKERQIIDHWLGERETDQGGSAPLIVAVRGDYGSGKTHLLLDAMAYLDAGLGQQAQQARPGFLPVATTAGRPLDWYRAVIGPRLAELPLEELVIGLYAKAGQVVADRATLTETAVDRLEREPAAVKELVGGDLLSSTAVEEVFQRELRAALPGSPDDIVRALALLRWDSGGAAATWLSGGELAEVQARLLKLPPSIDSDNHAWQVLLAVAALYRAAGRTFGLFVDEAEHFLRIDSEVGRDNATSMKRLLEGMARQGAVVFVAGHWSAWEAFPDYLDRFSPSEPLDLLRLTAGDVQRIVASRTRGTAFTREQAALVAELAGGSMRATMSLLRELFGKSDGFTGELPLEEITRAAQSLKRRPSPESVLLRVHELLEQLGLSVAREQRVAPGILFDLVASQAGRPRVLVTIKHASHELAQADQVLRMIEQMREVNQMYPEAIGCFLAETRLDPGVRDAIPAGSARRVLLSDTTSPDFVSELSSQLTSLLQASDAQVVPRTLWAAGDVAIGNVRSVQQNSARDLDLVLPDPEPAPPPGSAGPSRQSVLGTPRSEYRDQLGVTYAELTKRPTFLVRLSHVWSGRMLIFGLITFIGLFGAIFTIAQGSLVTAYSSGEFTFIITMQYLVSALLLIIGLFMIIRDVIQVEGFYEYRNERLRSIYLRDESFEDLIWTSDRLTKVFDEAGPRWRVLMNSVKRAEVRQISGS